MKIVIDICEEDWKDINDIHFIREDLKFKIGKTIMKGKPLPEHHGRLIDADALLDKKQDYGEGQMKLILIDPYYVRKAPTIIEGSESK